MADGAAGGLTMAALLYGPLPEDGGQRTRSCP